jgi:hypothetical protein
LLKTFQPISALELVLPAGVLASSVELGSRQQEVDVVAAGLDKIPAASAASSGT